MKWAEDHPGELASKLLKDMHNVVMGPRSILDPALAAAPPVAMSYYLTALSRHMGGRERHTKRELFTITTIMDLLALGKYDV